MWDGAQWVTTISHDGRYRWDGTQWVPYQSAYPAMPAPVRASREPTSWTQPLQYAVIAYYVLSAIYTLTLPFYMSNVMSQVMNQSIQRQQALNPQATPLPPGFADMMTGIMNASLVIGVVIGLCLIAVGILATVKRWTWAFYVILVFAGIGVLGLFTNTASLISASAFSNVYGGVTLPTWIYGVGLLSSLINTGLFVWMLMALIKFGPWAMRRVTV